MVTPVSPVDPAKSMFNHTKSVKLLQSPKTDIVDGDPGETFVGNISIHMLECFCSMDAIIYLLFTSLRSNQISVPPPYAFKDGIIRVIRYMRRWCQDPNHCPTGELRKPPSIKEGISTSLVCRSFNLHADADRMEKLVVEDSMCSPSFFITDEGVELIWCHYNGRLRGPPFEDSLVWFVLEEVMAGTHALADEVRWMLEQEEYKDLKARIWEGTQGKRRRSLGRKSFLRSCQQAKEQKVYVGKVEGADAVRDPRLLNVSRDAH